MNPDYQINVNPADEQIQPKKDKKKIIKRVLLIVLIIILMGGAGFCGYMWKVSNDKVQQQASTIKSINGELSSLKKTSTTDNATSISSSDSNSTVSSATTLSSISIKEWGIGGYYTFNNNQTPSTDENTLSYSIADNKLSFKSDDLPSTCDIASGGVGVIERYTSDQSILFGSVGTRVNVASTFDSIISANNKNNNKYLWHIGNYYYYLRSASAECTEDSNGAAAALEVANETEQIFISLHAE